MRASILKRAKTSTDIRTKQDCETSVSSLVTYLDASNGAIDAIKKGNLDKAKWILKTTAKEHIALNKSASYIDMMDKTNSCEIVDKIREEAYQ